MDPASRLEVGFRQIYAEHFRIVWRGLTRLGVPPAQIEDAVQDVFLVVYRRLEDYEGRSSLRTWIYGIAVRVAKDHRRSEHRRQRRVERYQQLSSAEPASTVPTDYTEQQEARQLLHDALSRLDDEQRAALVLVEFEELSVREAAQALELSPRTFQRRLRAARAAFETAVQTRLTERTRHE